MPGKKSPPRVTELRSHVQPPTMAAVHDMGLQHARQLALIDPSEIVVDASGSDSWCTPPELYEPVLKFLGAKLFDLDPCSNENATVPARQIFTVAQDGSEQDWGEAKTIWLNPPYSKPGRWIELLAAQEGAQRFALLKLDTTTQWYQQLWRSDAILFLRDRVRFLHQGQRQAGAKFPCVIVYWGDSAEGFALALADLGVVLLPEYAARRGAFFRRCARAG